MPWPGGLCSEMNSTSLRWTRWQKSGAHWARAAAETPNARLELGIRPEFITVRTAPDQTTLPVQVERVEDLGNYKLLTARLGAHLLKAKMDEDAQAPGETAHLSFAPARTLLYADSRLIG